MRLRRANIVDVPALMDLERQNALAAHWSREQYERLFANPEPDKKSGYFMWLMEADADPNTIAGGSAEILAFLIARQLGEEWELENVVVTASHRRRGIGTLLLEQLIGHAQGERRANIFLEVRESNKSARQLYRKLGFREVGLRKGYYSGPIENAVLYRLPFH